MADKKMSPQEAEKFYFLWYEYLRRSNPFKEYCVLSSDDERRGAPGNSLEAKHKGTQLRGMYGNFGNPWAQNFEEWFKGQKKRGVEYGQPWCEHMAVCKIDFFYYASLANRWLVEMDKIKKPTWRDVGKKMDDLPRSNMKWKLFLDIDLRAGKEQVLPLVAKLLEEHKAGKTFSKYDAVASYKQDRDVFKPQKIGLINHSTLPVGKRCNNELEKYLYAFDRDRQGADHIDITDEVLKKFPSRQKKNRAGFNKHYDQGLTECGRWIASAKKIISNLEWAQEFPGVY